MVEEGGRGSRVWKRREGGKEREGGRGRKNKIMYTIMLGGT